MIPRIFIGFDQREAVAFHVCSQSIIERASGPVAIHPLARGMLAGFDGQRDGSNAFTFSRYLVPYLCDFTGFAIFLDGDMVVDVDVAKLWEWQNVYYDKAIAVVQHEYKTKHPRKYIGSRMECQNVDYPRKNQSSVILWNCAHFANRVLMPEYVAEAPVSFLHRLEWVDDKAIGALPEDWNHLVGESPPASPALLHFTCGVPGLKHYADNSSSWKWHSALVRSLECAGEAPSEMVRRAEERVG